MRRREGITDTLRGRILRAMQAGALGGGDRLPSTREVAEELDADPRVVADAYRTLVAEGLVEMRPRAGVFVAPLPGGERPPTDPSPSWLASIIAEGVCRGVPARRLGEVVTAATRSRPMAAVVIASTLDQAVGIARELASDFGVEARALLDEQIVRGEALPRAVARAHVLVGTQSTEARVLKLGERLHKPAVVINPRADLMSAEWRQILRRTAYVVVADPRFRALVHQFVSADEGAHNVRVLVAGRDDLSEITPDAPAYVTEAARERLGRSRLPGRLLAPARTLCDNSVRTFVEAMVAHNLQGRAS